MSWFDSWQKIFTVIRHKNLHNISDDICSTKVKVSDTKWFLLDIVDCQSKLVDKLILPQRGRGNSRDSKSFLQHVSDTIICKLHNRNWPRPNVELYSHGCTIQILFPCQQFVNKYHWFADCFRNTSFCCCICFAQFQMPLQMSNQSS